MDELYRENFKIVYRYLCSISHNQQLAEDLTQETFLQAFISIDRYDYSCKLSVWLCQIAKHLYYQHLRKTGREVAYAEIDEQIEERHSVETQVFTKLELIDVLKKMQELSSIMREVIYLRVSGALSYKEIGQVLGRSENWARVTFFRAKEKLLSMVNEESENKKGGKNGQDKL